MHDQRRAGPRKQLAAGAGVAALVAALAAMRLAIEPPWLGETAASLLQVVLIIAVTLAVILAAAAARAPD